MNHSRRATRWVLLPLLLSLVLPTAAVTGTDSLHIVILSRRVGETIDRTEQVRFHLFPGVDALDSARVFRIDSKRCRVVFTLADPAGVQRESTVVIPLTEAFRLSEIIDHIEEIQQMRYASGRSAVTIWVGGREIVRPPAPSSIVRSAKESLGSTEVLRGWDDGSLPLAEPQGPRPGAMQYVFFVGAGVPFHTGSAKSVETMFAEIESRYSRAGFQVHGTPSTFNATLGWSLVLMLRPWESVRFTAEVSPRPSDGDFTIGYVSGILDYRVPLVRSGRVCWQSGLGLSFFSFRARRKYGDARISAIDSVKGYYMLDQIEAEGLPVGISAETGIALLASPGSEFVFYVRNTWCSELNVALSGGSVAALRFTDFHLGLRLVVGLY